MREHADIASEILTSNTHTYTSLYTYVATNRKVILLASYQEIQAIDCRSIRQSINWLTSRWVLADEYAMQVRQASARLASQVCVLPRNDQQYVRTPACGEERGEIGKKEDGTEATFGEVRRTAMQMLSAGQQRVQICHGATRVCRPTRLTQKSTGRDASLLKSETEFADADANYCVLLCLIFIAPQVAIAKWSMCHSNTVCPSVCHASTVSN